MRTTCCTPRIRATAIRRTGRRSSRAVRGHFRSTPRSGRSGGRASPISSSAAARRFASALEAGGATILNDVVLNQVLVRFGDGDYTREVVERVQREGTCWPSGTSWEGEYAMRISVCNWRTTDADVDRSVDSILAAAAVPA